MSDTDSFTDLSAEADTSATSDVGDRYLDEHYTFEINDPGGGELYVERVGPQDAPVIFYLHGGPGYNSASFRDLAGDMLEPYQVIYADQRGSGRSLSAAAQLGNDDEGRLEPSHFVHDVVAILERLELPAATLLAHGFGALIAVGVAAQYPERVERLILVNPWVDMPRLARTLQRQAAFLSDQSELALPPEPRLEGTPPDPVGLVDQAVSWLGGKPLLDTLLFPRPASRLRLEHSDAEALVGMRAQQLEPRDVWSPDVTGALAELEQPTVVLVGKEDKTCYPDQAEVILQAMPHALFSLVAGGHYPWLDDPETFEALLHQAMDLPTTPSAE